MKKKKELREKSEHLTLGGINPPLLILISGSSLVGKSTLAKFLKEHIQNNKL